VRDFAQVRGSDEVTVDLVRESLKLEGVDEVGLDKLDRDVLATIISRYDGGPVGIEALAATLQEEVDTLTDVVEPYLLQTGFLIRTASGRKASPKAYDHLHVRRRGRSDLQAELPLDA
jgi:Holliday junction DNA helicase RuvB